MFHVKHTRFHLPTQSRENIWPSTSSTPIRPTTRSIAAAALRSRSAANSTSMASDVRIGSSARLALSKGLPMPRQSQHWRFARRHRSDRPIGDRVEEGVDPRARLCRYRQIRAAPVERDCRPLRARTCSLRSAVGPASADGRGRVFAPPLLEPQGAAARRSLARAEPARRLPLDGIVGLPNSGGIDRITG